MTTDLNAQLPFDQAIIEHALNLVSRALKLADDYDEDIQTVVTEAAASELPIEEKRGLFTRIVQLLHNGGVEPDNETRVRLGEAVRREVEGLLTGMAAARAGRSDGGEAGTTSTDVVPDGDESEFVKLVERNSLKPHDVAPIPIFKGIPVRMREGYVDINTINLWKGNHRVELYVEEFRQREGREPEDHELLAILQGDLVSEGDKDDPFDIIPLAKSIAAKGVDRPPILTWAGQPKDGNRRIAAAKYVQTRKGFTSEERERARWVRVWVTPETTEDVIEAIVVALNFESDYKVPWEEYVKARLVVGRYKSLLDQRVAAGGRITPPVDREIKLEVAQHYAIEMSRVTRYIEMVRWANDFEAYHIEDRGLDEAKVRYKTNDIFQWFFELQAGRGATKLTTKLDADDDLKKVVYDLMYDVIDSGAHVRALHKVIADEPSLKMLTQAHEQADSDAEEAKKLITAAIAEAAKNSTTRKVGFEQFLKTAADRFGSAPPKQWETIDSQLLRDLRKVLPGVMGAIDGELGDRGIHVDTAS